MAPDKAPFAEITAHTNECWEPSFHLPFQGGSLPQAQHHHPRVGLESRGGQLLCGPGVPAQGLPLPRAGTAVCPRSPGDAGQAPAGAPRAHGSRTAQCPAQPGTGTHRGTGPRQAGHSPGQGAAVALVKPAWHGTGTRAQGTPTPPAAAAGTKTALRIIY